MKTLGKLKETMNKRLTDELTLKGEVISRMKELLNEWLKEGKKETVG